MLVMKEMKNIGWNPGLNYVAWISEGFRVPTEKLKDSQSSQEDLQEVGFHLGLQKWTGFMAKNSEDDIPAEAESDSIRNSGRWEG